MNWKASVVAIFLFPALAFGQGQEREAGSVSGNLQMLWQSYSEDPIIGAIVPPEQSGFNAFGNLIYQQGGFSAGMRYESYLNAVLGFPGRFKGSGIGYRYARYADPTEKVDFTIGNFYEQFGSGMILRAYEERALGIDNALDGIRLIIRPIEGVEVKAIYGKQRLDFDSRLINGPGIVRAVDGSIDVNGLFSDRGGYDWKTKIRLGAPCARQLMQVYEKTRDSVVGLKVTPADEIHLYGCATGIWKDEQSILSITEFIEKPSEEDAQTRLLVEGIEEGFYLSLFGQYILKPDIFKYLEENITHNLREKGEFQLTSCLDRLRQEDGFSGYIVKGRRFDVGVPDAYRQAILEFRNI